MSQRELYREVARLESINDQLMTEMAYLDSLLRSAGFSEGIESVKAVVEELTTQEEN